MPVSVSPLLAEAATPLDWVHAAAGLLLDSPVMGAVPVSGGGNNRVYRVHTDRGDVALKFYPTQAEDPRDRLGIETSALRFLERYSVSSVPRVIAESREAGVAAFTWMEGERVEAPGDRDVDAALRLVAELRALCDAEGADHLADASASVFSAAAVVRQIDERLRRLAEVSSGHKTLDAFVRGDLRSARDRITDWAKAEYDAAGIGFDMELDLEQRTLSPSDFGFHNARRLGDGRLGFVDFEYFGWDDPAKLVADFLLHAGMNLPPHLKRRFCAGATTIFDPGDGAFGFRLRVLYPMFALCWVLIVLNEYLPERWARRALANGGGERDAARAAQLDRARARLKRTLETYDSGPDLG